MTGKERVKIAMLEGEPDRVPVMCQLSVGHIVLNADCSPVEVNLNREAEVRNYLKLIKRYKFDGLLVNSTHTGNNPNWREDISCIENSPEGEIVTFKNGRKALYPWDESPQPLIKEKPDSLYDVDIEAINTWEKVPEHTTDIHKMFLKEAGDYLSIHASLASPFTLFVEKFGITEPLMALIKDPDICLRILEKYTFFYINWGKAIIDTGIEAIDISSPWGGSSFISREMYKKFTFPFETELIQTLKNYKKNIIIYNHTCGFINDRLELIAETGIDGLECMDPPPLGDMELADAKRRVGDKIFLKGNLDSPHTLLKLSREEVKEIAKKKIQEGAPDGGYILSSSCSVSPHVPPENLGVLSEVAEEYGRYPLDKKYDQL